jgi:hypothetical protein
MVLEGFLWLELVHIIKLKKEKNMNAISATWGEDLPSTRIYPTMNSAT